ncbi:MAG: hypothetical protein ABSF64_16835, partial [Bryobacteraceae bacterium]
MQIKLARAGMATAGLLFLFAAVTTAQQTGTAGIGSAGQWSFTRFDVPEAGAGADQGTLAISINTAGAVAGYYYDADNLPHGFVRAAGGTITTFDAPGAGCTYAVSINTAGAIAGYYCDAGNLSFSHGFVRAASGAVTTFDAPGAGTGE